MMKEETLKEYINESEEAVKHYKQYRTSVLESYHQEDNATEQQSLRNNLIDNLTELIWREEQKQVVLRWIYEY